MSGGHGTARRCRRAAGRTILVALAVLARVAHSQSTCGGSGARDPWPARALHAAAARGEPRAAVAAAAAARGGDLLPGAQARLERWLAPPPAWISRAAPAPAASGTWEGVTVPIRALDGPLRLLTPAVGRVALELADGERVEGRLLALGEGRVWIERAGVQLALEARRVAAIEQLPEEPSPAAARLWLAGSGGVFLGRLGSAAGCEPVLVTEGGARIACERGALAQLDPPR